ncbi:MAG: tetratricopeptide repeat protein, partial [Pirellulaceae bacterium]
MGTVWVARQTQPVVREVAIKLIKKGMDSQQVLSRFETERQAIASMDHPNISKIYDGGIMSDGRPFFVMELVQGVPITDYCDQNKLTPRQRLELFVPVCQAIQHAHQKGIIHRDIKPSNVLVANYDDRPVPKVIDFGIAKATATGISSHATNTSVGSMVGTPEYMSPEQALMNNDDIDTRSDVYSLGVLLYQLLTGSPPFSRKDLIHEGLLEMLRIIREKEPQKPSTKVATAVEQSTIHANQATDPKSLASLLKRELDWVVMKAMDKDRSRRYETANGLAADLRRYLAGEPVLAHPPSMAYQFRKIVLRYRGFAIATSLLFLSLFAGIAGTTWGLIRARIQQQRAEQALVVVDRERQVSEQARREEQRQRVAAERNAKLARESAETARIAKEAESAALQKETLERKKAQSVAEFIGNFFYDFSAASLRTDENNRINSANRNALIQMLDRGTEILDQRNDLEPKLDAQLRWIIGLNYSSVGELEKAINCYERAIKSYELADDKLLTMYVRRNLGELLTRLGNLDAAVKLQEENLTEITALAGTEQSTGLIYMRDLATTYRGLGRLDEAQKLTEDCLERSIRLFAADHDFTQSVKTVLAHILLSKTDYPAAIKIYDELYQKNQSNFGAEDVRTVVAAANLAQALDLDGQIEKSIPMFADSYAQAVAKLGADDLTSIQIAQNFANAYSRRSQKEKALPLVDAVLDALERQQFRNERSFVLLDHSCRLLEKYEMADKSESYRRKSLVALAKRFGPETIHYAREAAGLGNCLRQQEQWPETIKLLSDALPILEKQEPKKWLTLQSSAALGMVYAKQNQFDLARPLLQKGLTGMLLLESLFSAD